MHVRLRTRALPLLAWAAAMGGAAYFWHGLRGGGSTLGFAAAVEYTVASPRLGRIAVLEVAPGQEVHAGEVVAILDGEALDNEAAALAAERERLEATLRAVDSAMTLRIDESARARDEAVASANLSLRSAKSERAVKAAELRALEGQLRTLRGLVGQRMADRRELDALAVKRAGLHKEVAQADALIRELDRQAVDARARRDALPGDASELARRPIEAELAALVVREEALALRRREAALRAPADGRVAAIHLRPGELAAAGAAVVTIVSRDPIPGDDVVVCLRGEQAARVQVGEAVRLRPQGGDDEATGRVTRLAPRVAELPARCRRTPGLPEWGREAMITLDEPAPLLPGQAFTAALLGVDEAAAGADPEAARARFPGLLGEASAAPPPAATIAPPPPAEALPIEVPPALAARTRLEASALVWLPALGRFVVVSDDTGLPGADERPPWLFTMDARGRVDEAPRVIDGLDEVSDLEALAPGPGDSLYLLASQSRSRKGKRPPARQVFARVAIDGDGARVEASISLATTLEEAGREWLTRLGVPDLAALDLEGMTASAAGGLLIGLKAPLDPDDRAIVWHLPRPDALLAGQSPAEAGLRRVGGAPLQVIADGEARPGGIAELLELADGTLLIAATASGREPRAQSGALWQVDAGAPLAAARPLYTFPGRKPEGLALRADGRAIVLVFDAGADAPQWMELPWPAP